MNFFRRKKACPCYSLKNQRASNVPTLIRGLQSNKGARGEYLIQISKNKTQHNKLPWGEIGTYPTNTVNQSIQTWLKGDLSFITHHYHGHKSADLQSEGARSQSIKRCNTRKKKYKLQHQAQKSIRVSCKTKRSSKHSEKIQVLGAKHKATFDW